MPRQKMNVMVVLRLDRQSKLLATVQSYITANAHLHENM